MQSLARDGFSEAQVRAALHHDSIRELRFTYELLDKTNAHKAWLEGVTGAHVANNALADIKRTARFSITDGEDTIDYLSDRIRPYVKVKMADGGFTSFPQGVFLLTSPIRSLEEGDVVTRDVEAYDQLVILRDDKVEDRYRVAAGVNYITDTNAVKELLEGAGITDHDLEQIEATLPTDMEWDPGTPKLRIINDLLGAINFASLFFDENGKAVARAYRSPADAAAAYTYADDDDSVTFQEASDELDLFDVANKWVLVVSQPDRTPLSSTYVNQEPGSPTSTVNRGRTIVDFRTDTDAVDQATLDALAARLAFEASQVFNIVEFGTAIMPFHGEADVLQVVNSRLGVSAKYSEHTWEFDLKAGARMTHRVRKVISV